MQVKVATLPAPTGQPVREINIPDDQPTLERALAVIFEGGVPPGTDVRVNNQRVDLANAGDMSLESQSVITIVGRIRGGPSGN